MQCSSGLRSRRSGCKRTRQTWTGCATTSTRICHSTSGGGPSAQNLRRTSDWEGVRAQATPGRHHPHTRHRPHAPNRPHARTKQDCPLPPRRFAACFQRSLTGDKLTKLHISQLPQLGIVNFADQKALLRGIEKLAAGFEAKMENARLNHAWSANAAVRDLALGSVRAAHAHNQLHAHGPTPPRMAAKEPHAVRKAKQSATQQLRWPVGYGHAVQAQMYRSCEAIGQPLRPNRPASAAVANRSIRPASAAERGPPSSQTTPARPSSAAPRLLLPNLPSPGTPPWTLSPGGSVWAVSSVAPLETRRLVAAPRKEREGGRQ